MTNLPIQIDILYGLKVVPWKTDRNVLNRSVVAIKNKYTRGRNLIRLMLSASSLPALSSVDPGAFIVVSNGNRR